MRLATINKFRQGLQDKGLWVHPSLEFVCAGETDDELTVKVRKDAKPIPKHTVIMHCPSELTINYAKADMISDIAKIMFHPTENLSSSYNPVLADYVSCMPKEFSNLWLHRTGEGPNGYSEDVMKQWESIDHEFADTMKSFVTAEFTEYKEYMKSHPSCPVTFEQYKLAALIYSSRAWGEFGMVPTLDLVQHHNTGKAIVLSPLVDSRGLVNQCLKLFLTENPKRNVNVRDVLMLTLDDANPGDEVYINYGAKTNIAMYAIYGFVNSVKPHILISIGGPNLKEEIKKFLDSKGIPKSFALNEDTLMPAALVYSNRCMIDTEFDEKKDYSKILNYDHERKVVRELIVPLLRVQEDVPKRKEKILSGSDWPQLRSDLAQIVDMQGVVAEKSSSFLKQYWSGLLLTQY